MTLTARSLDQLSIDTIRTLAIDGVQRANSGHPGAPMGMAPMAYVLWTRVMRIAPTEPHWPDRDRFVLSAGHASMLLYALLHLTGYDLPLSELERFRQLGSRTPGHPEWDLTPGVEATTGPLGQGFANAVGMAIAERRLAAEFNRDGVDVVDHRTYVICSDGDLQEGISSEAASLAGHLRLGKLIVLYDDNGIQLDGPTAMAFSEDVPARFDAYGWHTQRVSDGNDTEAIEAAVSAAVADERPSLIAVRTHIGYGSPHKQDSQKAHGAPLGAGRGAAHEGGLRLGPRRAVPRARRGAGPLPSRGQPRRRAGDGLAGAAGGPRSGGSGGRGRVRAAPRRRATTGLGREPARLRAGRRDGHAQRLERRAAGGRRPPCRSSSVARPTSRRAT